ncbi:hypothetical protein GCK72_010600 [Caenorhabditis remanei]|uniref:THAP-type domain-containing protein n=1 Tax=Caenorhabditis remanei TaxID=31234 RepID=A0A6A5H3Q9_CAERE|nr:hypothetical protein GCK72_010600 [Caenorhabditis remanei]KAF1762338.1 hypothetical protein GCK72_010600 [Caenorhabditis remanei]
MDKRIDHDEEDRDSSEYEPIDDEEDDNADSFQQRIVYKDVNPDDFQNQYLNEQEPSTTNHDQMEIPVSMKIDYEEIYPHNTVPVETSHEIIEAEKVYYENEMEDLVYHEIYGEGNDQKIGTDKRIRNIVGSSASCIVCQRTESEKIRLFKWPKSGELREQWLHFFRLPCSVLDATQEPYICCYHFSSDTFVMMEDRIFWKMTALPKYRQRRPGLSEPFPWEPAMKLKVEQEALNQPSTSTASLGYRIRYRLPYNKHKSRNVHQVAIMTPVAQPHLFYEFHFNRYGLHNTKFYACLNCRKAKTESGIRDVIRTIHLDGYKFLSNGDPFNGHHFACRPHNIYENKSQWRPIAGQNEENGIYQSVEYMDPTGESLEWHSVIRPEVETPDDDVPHSRDDPPVMLFDNFENPITEEVIETEYVTEEPAAADLQYSQLDESEVEMKPSQKASKKFRIKCHLCLKTNFPSTQMFVNHLQKHILDEKQCKKCAKRISCDSRAICARRGICENCIS